MTIAPEERTPYRPVMVPTHWLNTTPVDSDDKPCTIEALDVVARAKGLYAEVSETLAIRNPNRRPISVDLSITMPDDAVVCGYALEIGGKLRDGVVVPKEQARVAFETERRIGADPGLVEATKGNLYRTRVYPVPSEGERKVRLDYVVPMSILPDDSVTLSVPLPAEAVGRRTIRVEVEIPGAERPVISGLDGSDPSDVSGMWVTEGTVEGEAATTPVTVTLPSVPSPLVMVERDPGEGDEPGDTWFMVSERVPGATDAVAGEVPSIKFVTILWDASGSRAMEDHSAEIALAGRYCEGAKSISLVTFSNEIHETRGLASADELTEALGSVRYDGGTDISALASSLPGIKGACDGVASGSVCVLFSDGMDTLSEGHLELPDGCDMLAVVSGGQRDMEALRQACWGHAFPLDKAPTDAKALAYEFSPAVTARRLAVTGTGVADVVDAGFLGSGRRCALGRLVAAETEIRLGDAGDVIAVSSADARPGTVLSHAWAARRVSLLSPRASENEEELLRIGRLHGVASPVSSLLVLETIGQWLKYDIEPPRSWEEMWESWHDAKQGQMTLRSDREIADRHLQSVERQWKDLLAWHDTEFPRRGQESAGDTLADRILGRGRPRGLASRVIAGASERMSGLRRTVWSVEESAEDDAPMLAVDELVASPTGAVSHDLAPESVPADAFYDDMSDGSVDSVMLMDSEEDTGVFQASAMAGDVSLGYTDVVDMVMERRAMFAASGAPAPSAIPSNRPSSGDSPVAPSVTVRPWMPDTPYLSALDEAVAGDGGSARDAYASMRAEYADSPSFFLDCAGWFVAHGDEALGIRILTNLAEMDVDNVAFLRMLGWRLREAGRLAEALSVLRKVLSLRGEDSQSHRDVALVLSEMAREAYADGRPGDARAFAEEAASHYREIALTPWARRAVAVALFAVEEVNVLRAWADSLEWEGEGPDIPPVSPGLDGVLDCDLRITMAWDADDTDIDIHVTEPSGEEAYYAHNRTYMGGRVSEDITDGFGPELYEIRKAEGGTYNIRAHYYASHQQTVFGPATCTLTVYTDWGREGQAQSVTTTRLDREHEMVPVGTASYGATDAPSSPGTDGTDAPVASSLRLGITVDEAIRILGEPSIREGGDATEALAWSAGGGRAIHAFFADGMLVRATEVTSWGDESVIVQ